MMMGLGLFWMIFLIALPVAGVTALIIWLFFASKKGDTNKSLRIGLIVTILVVLIVGLVLGLIFLNQIFRWFNFGPGWMMGNRLSSWRHPPFRMHRTWPGVGMHGFLSGCGIFVRPACAILSVEETESAVNNFLSDYGDDDLTISEIMIFDNQGYAVVSEKSTGIGAFELLIDPVTKRVYPEYGPNMMWNLKYGGQGHAGMMGGWMMPGWGQERQTIQDIPAEMPIGSSEALGIAQDYLDENYPGAVVSDHITPFYGYYTIDLARDADIFGMLSVNGYTGQVFYHHWHGNFVEMESFNDE